MIERACTKHNREPVEAELVERHGLLYTMLRCPLCHRPQGMRLVRRKKKATQ